MPPIAKLSTKNKTENLECKFLAGEAKDPKSIQEALRIQTGSCPEFLLGTTCKDRIQSDEGTAEWITTENKDKEVP